MHSQIFAGCRTGRMPLPVEAVADEHSGMGGFAAHYVFLDRPVRIHFRVLCARASQLDASPSYPFLCGGLFITGSQYLGYKPPSAALR